MMRYFRLAAIAAAALLSTGATKPVRPAWTATVIQAPGGSHVLGNPKAPVKLVEYASYTCSHCAHFEIDSAAALRSTYIAKGKVSFELRHLLRDPVDVTAALLTNCGPPARFFQNHAAFMRSQDRWIAVMGTASEAQQKRWSAGTMPQRLRAIASDFGFYAIMQQRGYNRAAVNRCLGDEATAQKIAQQTKLGGELGIDATPSFMIDGLLLTGTHDWPTLNAQLQARM